MVKKLLEIEGTSGRTGEGLEIDWNDGSGEAEEKE
jgi:hypothetical protein